MSETSNTRIVLITGASSGIGFAIAEFYVAKGWCVYGLSRSGKVPEGVVPLMADINKRADLKAAFEQLWRQKERLDAVIHAAGIGGAGPLESFPLEEVEKIMNTNFFGSLNVIQLSLPYLRRQSSMTHLVFISSIAGLMGVPFHAVYSASKFATEGMVECLRQELTGSGVQVVSVCPGDTATPIISHQFRSNPEDVPAFYAKNYRQVDTTMRESVRVGISPRYVAQCVYRVTQKRHPRVRYFIGDRLQQLSPYLKRVFPSRLFEAIMRNYYRLK